MHSTWQPNFPAAFTSDREALPAEALHCNASYLTAVANDYSYDVIYARLIQGIGKKGDFLVGLSTPAIPSISLKHSKWPAPKAS